MAIALTFYNSEFEKVVRDELLIFDRPITAEDALDIYVLDCSGFPFDARDYEALSAFKNLDWLYIDARADELGFLKNLPLLEKLSLETWGGNNEVDFNCFSCLPHLRELFVSGGDVSDIAFKNLEALNGLRTLEGLTLHEFGTVDLEPLRNMPWLVGLYVGYADEVYNMDAIAHLVNLECLTLIHAEMDSLDFLDDFSDTLIIDLCALKVRSGVDYKKLERFVEGTFDELERLY